MEFPEGLEEQQFPSQQVGMEVSRDRESKQKEVRLGTGERKKREWNLWHYGKRKKHKYKQDLLLFLLTMKWLQTPTSLHCRHINLKVSAVLLSPKERRVWYTMTVLVVMVIKQNFGDKNCSEGFNSLTTCMFVIHFFHPGCLVITSWDTAWTSKSSCDSWPGILIISV